LRTELNRGDFWLIASEEASSDLGGSMVIASQPVSVLSGNHCAYVPSSIAACDFIIEQETPMYLWGKKYYASPIIDRKYSSIVRLFAKEGPTTIKRDGNEVVILFTSWGLMDDAWVEMRANPDTNKPAVYHSDKPIYVVQYNSGMQEDNVPSDPFQLVLTPQEQFQREILFNTPGIRNGFGFKRNYINIIYHTDLNNQIPDDLELGELLITGETVWKKVKDISSAPGNRFDDPDLFGSNVHYYSKTVTLPYDAVYRLRTADQSIAAYAYGFANWDSYGFPTSMATSDLNKSDSVAPQPLFQLSCDGSSIEKYTYVMDGPENDTIRSNLALIIFDKNRSFNYTFWRNNFIPGETKYVKWGLDIIDPTQDARGYITFADRKGNDTTIEVIYNAVKLSISPKNFYFGNVTLGEEKSQQFQIKNESETSIAYIRDFVLKTIKENLPTQYFDLFFNFDLNEPLLPQDTRNFLVTFKALKGGSFRDSIGVGDTCFFKYRTVVRATVGTPAINVSDIDFGKVTVGTITNPRIITVSNTGTTSLTITGYKDISSIQYSHNIPIIDFDNPVILEKGEEIQFEIRFIPEKVGLYLDTIIFESDAGDNVDPVCLISGEGIEPQLDATGDDWGRKRVHLDRYDTLSYYTFEPYPAPTGAIELKNDGTKEVTINELVITENKFGSAFEIYVDEKLQPLVNFTKNLGKIYDDLGRPINVIQPGQISHVPVFFNPRREGEHILKFDYLSDAPKKASTSLTGTGIYPRLKTENVNFGSRIIGEPPIQKTIRYTNDPWEYQDSVTIQSIYDFPDKSIGKLLSKPGTEGFSYDSFYFTDVKGDTLEFPLVLQPGDFIECETAFSAVKIGNVQADIISISDAVQEANCQLSAFGILEKLLLIEPEEEYYCFDPLKEFTALLINNGTIGVKIPGNSINLIKNADSSFIIDRVQKPNGILIDYENEFTINPGDTLHIIMRYVPTDKPQSNIEEIHSCFLHVETASVIPESREYEVLIKIRTIRYTRQTESKINGNDEITVDLGRDINIDPVELKITMKPGKELEIANPTDLYITVQYEKSFIGINKVDGKHEISIGDGLPPTWSIADYTLNLDIESNIETLVVHLHGNIPFKTYLNAELLKINYMVFLPVQKFNDIKENNQIIQISHSISSILECLDFLPPNVVTVSLSQSCDAEHREIIIYDNDFALGMINPNPISLDNDIQVDFSIPYEEFIQIRIINSLGSVQEVLLSKKIKGGTYKIKLPVDKLQTGSYYLEMITGEFSQTRKFNVLK